MKKIILFVMLLFTVFYVLSCTSMGRNPEPFLQERIEQSPQYNLEKQAFENAKETPVVSDDTTVLEMAYNVFFTGEDRVPTRKLPEDTTALPALQSKSSEARFIWFGHSTIMLELDGTRILLDPMFTKYGSPIPGLVKRFQPAVYSLDQIDNVDVVLISHDHYDHLDYKTIKQLKDKSIQFFVPLGVGAHLRHWGIADDNITELDWWEATTFNGVTFTAAPSQHFSGRGLFNGNSTQWVSWAVTGTQQNIYFSGDTGYSEHFQTIGEKLGPFDLAFLENGAYNPSWRFIHQMPEEAVQANIDLQSKAMVPIHWGMFDLALHSWYEPIERVTQEADKRDVKIMTPKLGQLVDVKVGLSEEQTQERWWEAVKE